MAEQTVVQYRCRRCGALVAGATVAEGRKMGAGSDAVVRKLVIPAGQYEISWHDCADGQGRGLLEVAGFGYVGGA